MRKGERVDEDFNKIIHAEMKRLTEWEQSEQTFDRKGEIV